ncbi:hypothetical protein ONZ45_g7051 [Pleurotus djamor]|nr:hypothetical protein ONZ45_g7051 [Pleurotus djamor]
MFGPLGLSLAPQIKASRTLSKYLKPVAAWYANLAGYRRMGFKYDDLLVEERDDVQRALSRLTPAQGYDRIFRIRRAVQASVLHKDLPKEQWIKPEEDVRYLKPHVDNVAAENAERSAWDHVTVSKK